MDFRTVLKSVSQAFRDADIDYALIGGFALAVLGVPRTTGDLDFLVAGDRADDVDGIMKALGFQALHRSADAANYATTESRFGHVDFLFAQRPYSRAMLQRATPHNILGRFDIRVVQAEDIIGLKVQSSVNNPQRQRIDLHDIERLLASNAALDIQRIREYFRLFNREPELDGLLARQRPS